jgi:hypothetical protein
MDYEGIKTLLRKADERFPRLSHLWLDALATAERTRERGLGEQDPGLDGGSCRAPTKARPRRGADEVGEGVG